MQGYRDIGQLLAHARAERRLSIGEVAAALHIRPRYIVALEEGSLEKLPGFPYARGYIKRYALLLSLDKIEIMRRFELVAQEAVSPSFFMPHHFSQEKHIPLSFGLVCAGAALVMLLAWAWLRPDSTAISLVEPLPQKIMAAPPQAISSETAEGVACLRPQLPVYPPCYWPLPVAEPSVMTIITQ